MQRVIHTQNYKAVHSIFDDLEQFYYYVSAKIVPPSLFIPTFDSSLKVLQDVFNIYGKTNFNFRYENKHYEKLKLPKYDKRNIIVCFSGGKDSVTTALYYKKLKYNVILYHVKGLNRTYHDEIEACEKLANQLELPLIIETVSYSGNHDYAEHPMKNMILASMALNFGIKNDIGTKIAVGDFRNQHIQNSSFDYDVGDTRELWVCFERIVRRAVPRFKMYISLEDNEVAYNTLAERPELLENTISCVGPYRYREYLRKNHIKKYGVKLLEHRCGSCAKCAFEYIWFTDHDVFEYNEGYYKHCIEILRKTLKADLGVKVKDDKELWKYYFKYDIKLSKLYRHIKL